MILPDVNLLVYAVALGFIRLTTHSSVIARPLEPVSALRVVAAWLERPQVELLAPGPRHCEILERIFAALGVGGR